MTDAELITRLRADVDAHVITGNGGMKRVEAIRLAADRLTQLSEDNERLRQALRLLIYEITHLSPMEDDGSHRCKVSAVALKEARAALDEGQKEGE